MVWKNRSTHLDVRVKKTKTNYGCKVDSCMGGPTPSVAPSGSEVQEQLRPASTPLRTVDHPQTADPVLAFGKMAGDTYLQRLRPLRTWENTPGHTSIFARASFPVAAYASLVCRVSQHILEDDGFLQ